MARQSKTSRFKIRTHTTRIDHYLKTITNQFMLSHIHKEHLQQEYWKIKGANLFSNLMGILLICNYLQCQTEVIRDPRVFLEMFQIVNRNNTISLVKDIYVWTKSNIPSSKNVSVLHQVKRLSKKLASTVSHYAPYKVLKTINKN